jgi:hypothetical protein
MNSHNILEPVLGWPFGYSANHYSKLLLMKDLIPFLSSYAYSFIATFQPLRFLGDSLQLQWCKNIVGKID